MHCLMRFAAILYAPIAASDDIQLCSGFRLVGIRWTLIGTNHIENEGDQFVSFLIFLIQELRVVIGLCFQIEIFLRQQITIPLIE